jgi:CxxC-x17-CxxC domain-containing protein
MQDKTLKCQDCGKEFVFTAAEQAFYAEKGFTNEPKRCADCRKLKKMQNRGGNDKPPVQIVCANCGKTDTVSFKPRGDRPVLCSDCFRKQRDQQGQSQAQPATAEMQPGEPMKIGEEQA